MTTYVLKIYKVSHLSRLLWKHSCSFHLSRHVDLSARLLYCQLEIVNVSNVSLAIVNDNKSIMLILNINSHS